jgi:hypothetical protein
MNGSTMSTSHKTARAAPFFAKIYEFAMHTFSQGWGTFLRNHAPHIAAMDLFVVPTIGFKCSMFSPSCGWLAASLSGST